MTQATHLTIEVELLLASAAALSVIDTSDEDMLNRYDTIISVAEMENLTFVEASEQCGEVVSTPMLTILALTYLYQWLNESGESFGEAFFALAVYVERREISESDSDAEVLMHTLATLKPLAQSSAMGISELRKESFASTGQQILKLARLLHSNGHFVPARECAVIAAELLRRSGDKGNVAAGEFALRLMDQIEKRVFLTCIPTPKYPPRPHPPVPPEVLYEAVLRLIAHTFLGFIKAPNPEGIICNIEDFNRVVRQMLEDRDFVIKVPVQFEYEIELGKRIKCPIKEFEIRFAMSLLKRIDVQLIIPDKNQITPYNFLIDLLCQTLSNEQHIQHRRDQYFHDWFVLRGAEPYRENSFYSDAVVFVHSIGEFASVTIGEHEEDIDNWTRYERLAETSREFLRRGKSKLV